MTAFRLIALLSLTMLAPTAGQADVRVFFTQMQVNDCSEIGTCDWRLSCAVGNQQQIEFFNMVEANTGENIAINRVLSQREFPPVTVSCSAFEHDGGIGAEWEVIGTGDLFVRTTGPHSIPLRSSEGDVTIQFTVEATAATGQPIQTDPVPVGAVVPIVEFLMSD